MKDFKQVIVVRKDLKMSEGKLGAQCAHAAVSVLLKLLQKYKFKIISGSALDQWLVNGQTKIVLGVSNEEELLEINRLAEVNDLPCKLITDAARTHFKEPTHTCVAIGPARVDKIDQITHNLKLI
jgi:peptidyl-tRNA hydrolase, PTH2 family